MEDATNAQSCRWVPWGIAGGFVLLTAVLGVMTTLAVRGFPGVWTEHAYEKGLGYNNTIKAASAQKSLGWIGELNATTMGDRRVEIQFGLKDAKGAPIKGAETQIWFVRPSDAAMDIRASLTSLHPGIYDATERLPVPGVWDVKVSATYESQNYQISKRIVVP